MGLRRAPPKPGVVANLSASSVRVEGFPKTEERCPEERALPMSGVGFQEGGLSQDRGGRPRREGFAQDQEQDIAKIRVFGGKKRNFRNLLHLMVHLYSLLIPNA